MRKYHHTGFPTNEKSKNEIYLPEVKATLVANSDDSPYRIKKLDMKLFIQLQRLLKTLRIKIGIKLLLPCTGRRV